MRTVSRSESHGRGSVPQIIFFRFHPLSLLSTALTQNVFGVSGKKKIKNSKKCEFRISGCKSLTRPYVFDVVFVRSVSAYSFVF